MWEEETTDNKFIGCFLNTDLNLYWGVRRWFLNTDYTDYTVFFGRDTDYDFIGCEAVRVFEHGFHG